MNLMQMLVPVTLLMPLCVDNAASPGNAPSLPITGARIVNVSTEPQLQTALGNLQDGDTLLLADGTYSLTTSLYINGRHNVTLRGKAGSTLRFMEGRGEREFAPKFKVVFAPVRSDANLA